MYVYVKAAIAYDQVISDIFYKPLPSRCSVSAFLYYESSLPYAALGIIMFI
jgi:hypothetical protein